MRLPWAVILLLLLGARYLHWRVTDTLNLATPLAATVSLLALAAEALLLFNGFLVLLFSLWLPPRGRLRAAGDPAPDLPPTDWPLVDVLVPSYGEPLPLIERGLRACLDLEGPPTTVWLLDDSGRPELRRLCEGLGVRYLARQERLHAKAGNLNHALPHGSGELIAVFDADVIPLPDFLRRTVPLFADPDLGFVQTPQSSMNADPVMRNLGLERWLMPDEESFYRWIEPCRDAVGAVVCAGTSFVMRRSALERVGGFETGTPSEDLATGIRLTAAGYSSHYLPEKLSAGLAPFSVEAMARQRCRWASGTLQLLFTGANPLTIPGLTPLQRLAYCEGILHWFCILPQFLLSLLPLSLGLLGIAPLLVSGDGLLVHALPFYGAQLLLTRWLSGHSRNALLPELYRWIFLVPLALSVLLTLLGRPQPFRVTPKALASGRRTSPAPRLVLPLLFLLTLQLVSLLNLQRPLLQVALAPLSTATLAVTLSGLGFSILLLLLALRACCDRPGLSEQPWFALPLFCHLLIGSRRGGADVLAISESGVELRLDPVSAEAWADRDAADPVLLELPGLPVLPLLPLVRAHRRDPPLLGGVWGSLSEEQRQALRRFLFGRPGLWPVRRAPFEPLALARVPFCLLRSLRPEDWFRRSLLPQNPPPVGWTPSRKPDGP
jgi:cellulose synthase (UDP-forming)